MSRIRPFVTVFLGISIDGYIAGQEGDLSWLSVVETNPPEDTGYNYLMMACDVIIMGRNTYDAVAAFDEWPYEGKHVVVLTTRETIAKHGERFYKGDLTELLYQLYDEGFKYVYLDGGKTVRLGLNAGVVDELTLNHIPTILGSGVPLFTPQLPLSQWRLTSSKSFPSGLVQTKYITRY